ncbi:MAG: GYD domain-containing protein [candidate division NC10 bacterium]|nr:GYD domain-containing protein [candidate division NC10 bacterium]
MASFVTLAKFTEQGIKAVNQTTKRAEAFRDMAKKMGATVKEIYWTLGRFDVVAIFEAPDDETATRLMLSLGSLGNVRTETLRAYEGDEVSQGAKVGRRRRGGGRGGCPSPRHRVRGARGASHGGSHADAPGNSR